MNSNVNYLTSILIAAIAGLHLSFLIIEMFFWSRPIGLKVFRQSVDRANATKILAANQGLYNGFLTAGLAWSLLESNPILAIKLKVFFLVCVLLAGLYGGYSVNKRIFWIQGLPALLTLGLLLV